MESHKHKQSIKEQCIIHQNTSKQDDDHLVSPQDHESWKTLFEAVKVRNYAPGVILNNG